jgi:hypothetical protein
MFVLVVVDNLLMTREQLLVTESSKPYRRASDALYRRSEGNN